METTPPDSTRSQYNFAEQLSRKYIPVCLIILVSALFVDHYASSIDVVSREISIVKAGHVVTTTTLTLPFKARILQLLSTFLYTLAASIFISAFVTNRLEQIRNREYRAEQKKLADAINKNVFDALFKTLMPKEIFEIIKDEIIKMEIVRRNALWTYDFTEVKEGIQLRTTLKYEFHNVSDNLITDPLVTFTGDYGSETRLEKVLCVCEGTQTNFFDHDLPKKVQHVTVTQTSDHMQKIEASFKVPPKKHVDVTYVFRTIYPKECVKDVFFSKHAVIGARLMATYPPEYELKLLQSFSKTLESTLEEPGRSIFETKGGILPQQGFLYSLERKRETGEVGASEATSKGAQSAERSTLSEP